MTANRSRARSLRLAAALAAFGVLAACSNAGQQRESVAARRTPAATMSWRGADWLTRDTRIEEEQPDRMLAALDIRPGQVVADIGAGVGYHVLRIARLVGPTGTVIGEDIQPEMIRMLEENVRRQDLHNVRAVLGDPDDPKLPEGGVDLILMVDVYHELADPAAMLRKLRQALKPTGRIVLVEFRGEDPDVPIRPEHKMTLRQIRAELEAAGFRFQSNLEFLPWQHIVIFGI